MRAVLKGVNSCTAFKRYIAFIFNSFCPRSLVADPKGFIDQGEREISITAQDVKKDGQLNRLETRTE